MKTYKSTLLSNWEDVFKQGLLTFWLFVAIKDVERDVADIKKAIEKLTEGSYVTSEQALYRVLRKHYDLELVDYREVPSANGPKKKLYSLSDLGHELLREFTQRNICLFMQPDVQELMVGDKK